MKKRHLKTLRLRKTPISAVNQHQIIGGGSEMSACCENQSYGTCDKEKPLTPGCDQN
ncbi:hypothetical protein C8N46_10245 [Kordia periserrulae]|uniref:Uncharacterized protein n=1 Tax=Kordia periserrulae TaxID=701523 RepID=A0A2T6C2U7_9FLAO|nr:hypothetical protein [Kordia periserrulae]PTX62649.1 hypothetical protein C8N46_10245 [Kordia periserrulae]